MISRGRNTAGRALGVLILWMSLLMLTQAGAASASVPPPSPDAWLRARLAVQLDAGPLVTALPIVTIAGTDARSLPEAEAPDAPTTMDEREWRGVAETMSLHGSACLPATLVARTVPLRAAPLRHGTTPRSLYWITLDRRDTRGPPVLR